MFIALKDKVTMLDETLHVTFRRKSKEEERRGNG